MFAMRRVSTVKNPTAVFRTGYEEDRKRKTRGDISPRALYLQLHKQYEFLIDSKSYLCPSLFLFSTVVANLI